MGSPGDCVTERSASSGGPSRTQATTVSVTTEMRRTTPDSPFVKEELRSLLHGTCCGSLHPGHGYPFQSWGQGFGNVLSGQRQKISLKIC